MCGFSILSNSPVLCRPQLGTLQFNSWWQQLPRIRVDPQVKGSVPRLLPFRHQPQVAGCRRYLWLTSHKPRVPRTLSSGSILFWNGSQNSGKHSYQFIMRNTAQERPDGSDAKGNLWEGRPLQAATLLACGRAHQPGISPDPVLQGVCGGFLTWTWLIKGSSASELNLYPRPFLGCLGLGLKVPRAQRESALNWLWSKGAYYE